MKLEKLWFPQARRFRKEISQNLNFLQMSCKIYVNAL